jgi:N-methylhydantoinase A
VNETMASAARAHVLERGKDPQALAMFAFGGAGPVHGYRVARALGSRRMIVPLGAGIMSTLGFLTAPAAFDFVRPWRVKVGGIDWAQAEEMLGRMEDEGRALLLATGIAEVTVERTVGMRYVGQGHEIGVVLTDEREALRVDFERAYRQLYGRPGPPVEAEVMNWRVTVSGPRPTVRLRIDGGNGEAVKKGTRKAYFPELGGYAEVPVLNRYGMPQGYSFTGPAIVEERESTAVIGPGARCFIDGQWNLVVEMP